MGYERRLRRPPHFDLGSIPYFATTRTAGSRRVFLGTLADLAVTELFAVRERYKMRLFAYCFMPDHAHFVIVPGAPHTLSQTMRLVKGSIARRINEAEDTSGKVWQEGYFDKAVRSVDQLNQYIKYTQENPVKAGLCDEPEGYPFSSAGGRCLDDYHAFFEDEREEPV
jgi:REP element-mobilizing transposase RayT